MKRLLLTLLAVSGLLNAGVAQAVDPASLLPIRFSALGISTADLYMFLGVQKGIYAANGVDLRIVQFQRGGPESIAAAASNQVDMGSVGTPLLTGISRGLHLKVVGAPPYSTQPFVLVSRTTINDVADLRGRNVAFGSVGGGAEEAAKYILTAHHVDPREVHNVGGGSTAPAFLALKAGRVDAAVLTEPYVTQAQFGGFGKVLARAEDYFGHYEHSYIFASESFIDQHPDAIKRFFVANRAAVQYAKAHPDELDAFGSKLLNLDPAVTRSVMKQTMARWDGSGRIDQQGLLNAIRIVQDVGDISKGYQARIDQITDLRFVGQTPDTALRAVAQTPRFPVVAQAEPAASRR